MSRSYQMVFSVLCLVALGLLLITNEPVSLRSQRAIEKAESFSETPANRNNKHSAPNFQISSVSSNLPASIVTGISMSYDRIRSLGNVSQIFLKNEIIRGAPDGNILLNYTVEKAGSFRDRWLVSEGITADLIFPEMLSFLHPTVNEVGQLFNTWAIRKNFKFNTELTYEKRYLFWVMVNIPAGKCREIQVRTNNRDFVIPFTATLGLLGGQERIIKGWYIMNSKADMQAKHRAIHCP